MSCPRQISGRCFEEFETFLLFFLCQFSCPKLCLDGRLQEFVPTIFYIRLRQISLKLLLHFPVDILTFVPIYCCSVVQTLRKQHEHELFWFRKKCESPSVMLHAALNNFTHQADVWIYFTYTVQFRSINVL
jgi:hypothetical protein